MRKQHGFTLIELLVVMAIIGLLMSILMPSLSSARQQARSTVCLANLRRLSTAMILYANNHREKLPPFRLAKGHPTATEEYVNSYGRAKPRWHWFLDREEVGPVIEPEPFLDEIESSGSFGDNSIGSAGERGTEMTNDYFLCPSHNDDTERDERNGAYGYNYQYLGNARQDTDEDRWDYFPVGLAQIKSAGGTVLFADSRGAGRRHGAHSYTLDPPRLAVERHAEKFGPGAGDVDEGLDPDQYAYSPVEARHGDRGNVVFLDGHASPMTLADLGYELDENDVPRPILDPNSGTYSANNKLWNGEGRDSLAAKHRP